RIAEDIVEFSIQKNLSDPVTFLKKTFRPDFNVAELHSRIEESRSTLNRESPDFFAEMQD
ncbi:hypothetical protein, partial [Foetidibacter luteolus]|uniref:hypothetical protein n=1 Tax=Foetidibacter luteolus TaxID=2608880 RepID=UPI001A97E93C